MGWARCSLPLVTPFVVGLASLQSAVITASTLAHSSHCTTDSGELIAKTSFVATADEASQLNTNLRRCPGHAFEVAWQGAIEIAESFELSNGTYLKIVGLGNATMDGGSGSIPLFVVNGSDLELQGMSLTGGRGVEGGMISGRDGASVTLTGCDIFGNAVSSRGGAVHLDHSTCILAGATFWDNTADVFGGAISAYNKSTVMIQDDTDNILESNWARYGGALYGDENSRITFGSGNTTLRRNSVMFQGGAIYAETNCDISVGGNTVFFRNKAAGSNGGAIFAKNGSTVVVTGNTSFIDNESNRYGGAIMVTDSTLSTSGTTVFNGNYAKYDGGAIQADKRSNITIDGVSTFGRNSAEVLGGAINVFDDVALSISGRTRFTSNIAGSGGAVCAEEATSIKITGKALFDNNTAHDDGGALHVSHSNVRIYGKVNFYHNTAEGSGGGLYCNTGPKLSLKNANFVKNSAGWGGAVATFSCGSQQSSSSSSSSRSAVTSLTELYTTSTLSDSTESPVKYKTCKFEENEASEDGGAIYSVGGFDIIRKSTFNENRAGSEGGALVHAGVCEEVSDSTFTGNAAGNEGPAILSLGLMSSMVDTVFEGNEFYCEAGTYSSEEAVGKNSCRFTRVCSRCTSDCDGEMARNVLVESSELVPVCSVTPSGSKTLSRGASIENIQVLPGFYRSMPTSVDIRECFHEDACKGGKDVSEYCAAGYRGPYCAICEDGYAPGYHHTCKSCMGSSRTQAVAVMAVVMVVFFVVIGFVIARLVSVVEQQQQPPPPPPSSDAVGVNGSGNGGDVSASSLGEGAVIGITARWTARDWQQRVMKNVPLTAVKIVVVVWQIVTQYSDVSGVKYPGAYEDFLSLIDLVNLDIGFILSFACVYDTTFYDRLMMATLGPLVVLCVLGCTYRVALRRNRSTEEAVATIKSRHLSVALFVMFVVYSTVSHTIFETFVCDTLDDGESYLRADYSLTCTTDTHQAYQVYAGLMVLVYPLGLPCIFCWWLMRHRYELKTETNRKANIRLRPAADLWEPYKRDKYYYEVVECVRRIALTGLAVFIYPDSSAQIAVVLLLAVIFMVVSEILAPFVRPVEMWLYRAGHYVVFASMYLALLLRVDVSTERSQSQEVFSGVIVIAHAVMLLVVVVQGLLIFLGWGELVETPEGLKPIDRSNDRGRDGALDISLEQPFTTLNPVYGDARFATAPGRTRDPKREKKWEVWERPLPTAKSSFFPHWNGKEAQSPGIDKSERRKVLEKAVSIDDSHAVAAVFPDEDQRQERQRSLSLSPKRWLEAREAGGPWGGDAKTEANSRPLSAGESKKVLPSAEPEKVVVSPAKTLKPWKRSCTTPKVKGGGANKVTPPLTSWTPGTLSRVVAGDKKAPAVSPCKGDAATPSQGTGNKYANTGDGNTFVQRFLLQRKQSTANESARVQTSPIRSRRGRQLKAWNPSRRGDRVVVGPRQGLGAESPSSSSGGSHFGGSSPTAWRSLSPKRWFGESSTKTPSTTAEDEFRVQPLAGGFHRRGASYSSDGSFRNQAGYYPRRNGGRRESGGSRGLRLSSGLWLSEAVGKDGREDEAEGSPLRRTLARNVSVLEVPGALGEAFATNGRGGLGRGQPSLRISTNSSASGMTSTTTGGDAHSSPLSRLGRHGGTLKAVHEHGIFSSQQSDVAITTHRSLSPKRSFGLASTDFGPDVPISFAAAGAAEISSTIPTTATSTHVPSPTPGTKRSLLKTYCDEAKPPMTPKSRDSPTTTSVEASFTRGRRASPGRAHRNEATRSQSDGGDSATTGATLGDSVWRQGAEPGSGEHRFGSANERVKTVRTWAPGGYGRSAPVGAPSRLKSTIPSGDMHAASQEELEGARGERVAASRLVKSGWENRYPAVQHSRTF